MKIFTWNINGIRASKVPLKELFDGLDADIICIQETKVTSKLEIKSVVDLQKRGNVSARAVKVAVVTIALLIPD